MFEETLEKLRLTYMLGERIYTEFAEKRPAGTGIMIMPKHPGDTLWLCAFAYACKEVYGYEKLLAVFRESQRDIVSFFPDIDLMLPMDTVDMEALQTYICINELWYQNEIRWAFKTGHISIGVDNLIYLENGISQPMLQNTHMYLGLPKLYKPHRAKLVYEPFSEELSEKYKNAVMLLPGAQSIVSPPPETFWKRLADELNKKGYMVYSNYNGLPYEYIVEGSTPLSTSFKELVNLSRYFKGFVGLRSGALDVIAETEAPLVSIYPCEHPETGIDVQKEALEYSNLSNLGRTENIWNYQYNIDMETELIENIIEKIQ